MDLFHIIPDAEGIIRIRGAVFKQVKLYQRKGRVFIGAQGGFVRITTQLGDEWGTSAPGITVIDLPDDIPKLKVGKVVEYG